MPLILWKTFKKGKPKTSFFLSSYSFYSVQPFLYLGVHGIGDSESLHTPYLGQFVTLGSIWGLLLNWKHGFDHYGKEGDVGVPAQLTADKGCDQIVSKSQSQHTIVNGQVQLARRPVICRLYCSALFTQQCSLNSRLAQVAACLQKQILSKFYPQIAYFKIFGTFTENIARIANAVQCHN